MAVILTLLEGISIFAAVCGTIYVWVRPLLINWIDVAAVLGQAFAFSLCFIVAFCYNDLYDLRILRSFGEFASRLPRSFGVTFILLAALYPLFPETQIADGPFVSSLLISVGIIIALLLPLRAVFYGVMRSRLLIKRLLILGTTPLAHKLIEEIEAYPHCRYAIVGVVDDVMPFGEPPFRYPLLGPLERLDKIIEEFRPDGIIVALAERRGRLPVRQLLEARVCSGIVVEDGVAAYERLTGKLAIESLTLSSLIFSKDFRKSRLVLAVRRGISVVVAVIGLVGLAPLFGLIALAIKLDSRGPVFFVQERVGLCGKRFKLIKFRTMHPANRTTSEWVRDNGDRITRVGRWLRRFHLDELPQFVNILRGDMNLVGPRPHPVSNFELFLEKIPYYSLRSTARPGLTGWAQIRYGYANDLEEEIEKMRYDLYYIKHMSLWLDLRILFDTVKILLLGRESQASDAYRAEAPMGVSAR